MKFSELAKQFHRKAPLAAARDCGLTADPDLIPVNDEEKKKEPEKEKENETLSKWFEREKKKPQPKDEWSPEAREKAAESRKSGGLPEKSQPGGKGDHPEQKKEFRQERAKERAENRAERRSERKRY